MVSPKLLSSPQEAAGWQLPQAQGRGGVCDTQTQRRHLAPQGSPLLVKISKRGKIFSDFPAPWEVQVSLSFALLSAESIQGHGTVLCGGGTAWPHGGELVTPELPDLQPEMAI